MAAKMKRRVPVCAINFCCPYRNDLCGSNTKGECSGERIPKHDYMIVEGDYAFIKETSGSIVRYALPEQSKEFLRDFDRGCSASALAGRAVKLEAIKPT
jgi:hypothetical protein